MFPAAHFAKKYGIAVCLTAIFAILQASFTQAQFDNFSLEIRAETDSCDATNQTLCDPEKWLICNTNVSKCQCESGMVTFAKDLPCVSKINSTCFLASAKPMKCIDNAFCLDLDPNNPNGTCACKDGYLPEPNLEFCTLGFKQPCNDANTCNYQSALLLCIDKECVCKEGHIWDPINSKCRSTVGQKCGDGLRPPVMCVEKAVCDQNTSTCGCATNFTPTPTNECKLAFNQNCTKSDECHPNFQCIETDQVKSSCGCDLVNQEYDPDMGTCKNLVGKPCNTGANPNPNCVENAICSTTTKTCVCQADFTQSSAGKCVLGYDTDCAGRPDICNPDSKLECNTATHRCRCSEGYDYNDQSKKCLGLPNTNCTFDTDCYDLATCNAQKQCACKAGYSITPDNQCLLTHEQACQGTLQEGCNPYQFLICDLKQHICTCESSDPALLFSQDKNTCVSPPEGVCFLSAKGGRQLDCVGNATCSDDSEDATGIIGKCKCAEGFTIGTGKDSCVKGGALERVPVNLPLGIILAAISFMHTQI